MTDWPEPVERVSAFLRAAAVDARIEEFSDGTPTAREAAKAVGCELGQIVKSVVLVCDGAYVLALVPGDRWADAKVHVGVHGLHYGSGVFEGIRCYDTPKGPAVFRLGEHMQRLHNSARLLHMQIPYLVDELKDATNELLGANGLDECYIRPIAFYGYGQLGVHARGNPVETGLMSWPWGSYLGDAGLTNGIPA